MRGVPRRGWRSRARPSAVSATPRMRGGPVEDRGEVVGLVVVEAGDEPEAVAQRVGDHAAARRRADEREAGQVEADRLRRRALAEHDVEREVLHRRVEHLLDGAGQPVDLVDEEDVAVVEVREDRGDVPGALERGPARDPQADVELGGDDAGEASSCRRRVGPASRRWSTAWCRCRGRAEHDLEVLLAGAAGRRSRRGAAAAASSPPPRSTGSAAGWSSSSRTTPPRPGAPARRRSASRSSCSADSSSLEAGERVAHLVGAVAEAGERLADLAARRAPRAPASGTSTSSSRRALSSRRRRCAVRFPTPGTSVSASTSSSSNAAAQRRAARAPRDRQRELRADAGRAEQASKVSRSSRVGNPYRTSASSRTWRWVKRNAGSPGHERRACPIGTSTR